MIRHRAVSRLPVPERAAVAVVSIVEGTMARSVGVLAKVVAVVFTSVVAPVVVNVATRDLTGNEPPAAHEVRTSLPRDERTPPAPPVPAPPPAPAEVTEVIAHGAGGTPDEAVQDALRTALARAVAAHVDAETWARYGSALVERVAPHAGELIRSWKELTASRQWRWRGPLYHCEVAVALHRQALADRLRAVPVTSWARP